MNSKKGVSFRFQPLFFLLLCFSVFFPGFVHSLESSVSTFTHSYTPSGTDRAELAIFELRAEVTGVKLTRVKPYSDSRFNVCLVSVPKNTPARFDLAQSLANAWNSLPAEGKPSLGTRFQSLASFYEKILADPIVKKIMKFQSMPSVRKTAPYASADDARVSIRSAVSKYLRENSVPKRYFDQTRYPFVELVAKTDLESVLWDIDYAFACANVLPNNALQDIYLNAEQTLSQHPVVEVD